MKIRTIQKILWYKPFPNKYIQSEIKMWYFNGAWTNKFNLNILIKEIIRLAWKIYKFDKRLNLYNDLQQLFYRHDKEYHFKILKIYADFRLVRDICKLVHWLKLRHRILIFITTFFTLTFSKESRLTYKK